MSNSKPVFLSGLSEIADRYDGFILDLWGVIHDGVKPFPGVHDALRRVGAAGKRRLVLSNAPRRATAVIESMTRLGVATDVYDAVLSSGEATWQALARRDDPWHAALGTRCLLIGPPRDDGMLEGNGLTRAEGPEAADFVLATGPREDDLKLAAHEELLQACLRRGLKMVCANPDLIVMRGTQLLICAGALAGRYRELGGDVRYHGKPDRDIYLRALKLLGLGTGARVLAIGDSFRTDVAGALGAGLDVAFVPGGIHGEELGVHMGELPSPDDIQRTIALFQLRPTWVLPELRW